MTLTFTIAYVAPVLLAAGGDPNPFAGTIYQALAAVIAFLVLFFLLKKFAWGPILSGLQDREGKIKYDLEHAERSAKEAAATLASYQKQLALAHQEAAALIEQGRADAVKVATQMKEQTQTEIAALKLRATDDITAAKQQAVTELYQHAAALATRVAGKILQRDLQPSDQKALVDQALREMDNAKLN